MENKKELWKPINIDIFYDNYDVSNTGNVRNNKTKRNLSQHIRSGYKATSLTIKGKSHTQIVHRLVALTFLYDTYEEGYVVNHKDGNKFNNNVENLEWVTESSNVKHARKIGLKKDYKLKVNQYDKNNNFIATYDSIQEAAKKLNITDSHISSVCKGKRNFCGGYQWRYTDDIIYEEEQPDDCKEVSNFPNYLITKDGKIFSKKSNKYLKLKKTESGYLQIKLYNRKLSNDFSVHFLVASAYLDNPNNKKFINHIDCDKTNNKLENLEWATHSENMIHANEHLVITHKKVAQYTSNGKLIKVYDTIKSAAEENNIGNNGSHITMVCRDNYKDKTAGGFIWRYIDDENNIPNNIKI